MPLYKSLCISFASMGLQLASSQVPGSETVVINGQEFIFDPATGTFVNLATGETTTSIGGSFSSGIFIPPPISFPTPPPVTGGPPPPPPPPPKEPTARPTDAPKVDDLLGIDLFSGINYDFTVESNGFRGASGVAGFDSVQFEVRTINATGNNLEDPLLGAAHQPTVHCGDHAYGDGISTLAGSSRPGARQVSNQVFGAVDDVANNRGLTQFAWQWGQFIDHDVTLIPGSTMEAADILIPGTDPVLGNDPALGDVIAFNRSPAAPNTGVPASISSMGVPREQVNDLTAFVDGSVVYGHEPERAEALRLHEGGLMRIFGDIEFGILPRNSLGLENEPELEPEHFPETLGVSGDPRPNEQIGLYNMHTILLRLHNMLAKVVWQSVRASPMYNDITFQQEDEIVYQYTKLIVTAIIQKITYKDWLPALFGEYAVTSFLGEWPGYYAGDDPSMCIEFATAAFRFGHTMLPNSIPLRNADCSPWVPPPGENCDICDPQVGGIPLKDAFFVQGVFLIPGFFEAAHNGFHCTLAGEVDLSIVDGVRDFLFQNARVLNDQLIFATELDLVSLNLQRGREHGLSDYNELRRYYRLTERESFDEISSDPSVRNLLQDVSFGNIDNIDAFVGLLAEDHLPQGSFGETMSAVVLGQFKRLRDGDRFWYEHYLARNSQLLQFVESWTLDDIIRETSISEDELFPPTANVFINFRAVPPQSNA